jgi:hypothetical protein
MSLDEAGKWLDHLGSCSPCYRDFSEFRRVQELRQKRTLLAIAASILVVAGMGSWFLVQRHKEALVAQTVVLDLRNRSVPRGTEPNLIEPPLVVSRTAAHWNIFLPFGSDAGPYDIRLLASSGELLVSTKGDAKLTDGVAVIQISADLSSRSPGKCVLRLARSGAPESSYLVELR